MKSISASEYRRLISKGAKVSKYRAVPTRLDGIRFASKKEAEYYKTLKILKAQGVIKYFLMQVPFHLPGEPRCVRYICDFVEFWENGEIRYVDVKGFRKQDYINKAKQVRALFGVEIREA